MSNNKSIPMPRIQGKAIPSKLGGWTWEMVISVGDADQVIEFANDDKKKTFPTKKMAIKDLQQKAQEMAEKIGKDVYGRKPDGYMDLIKNRFSKEKLF